MRRRRRHKSNRHTRFGEREARATAANEPRGGVDDGDGDAGGEVVDGEAGGWQDVGDAAVLIGGEPPGGDGGDEAGLAGALVADDGDPHVPLGRRSRRPRDTHGVSSPPPAVGFFCGGFGRVAWCGRHRWRRLK